jgi:hypothetical protein
MWKMKSLVTLLSLFSFSDSVRQPIATTVTPPPKPSLTPPRNPLRSAWSLAWCECGAANGTDSVVAVWPDGLDPSDGVNVTYNSGSPTWLTWGRVVQSVQWRCSGSTKTGTTSLSPPSRVWSVQVRCHARAHTHARKHEPTATTYPTLHALRSLCLCTSLWLVLDSWFVCRARPTRFRGTGQCTTVA